MDRFSLERRTLLTGIGGFLVGGILTACGQKIPPLSLRRESQPIILQTLTPTAVVQTNQAKSAQPLLSGNAHAINTTNVTETPETIQAQPDINSNPAPTDQVIVESPKQLNSPAVIDGVSRREEIIDGEILELVEFCPNNVTVEVLTPTNDDGKWDTPERQTLRNRLQAMPEESIFGSNGDYFGDGGAEGPTLNVYKSDGKLHVGWRVGLAIYKDGHVEIRTFSEDEQGGKDPNILTIIGGGPKIMKSDFWGTKIASLSDDITQMDEFPFDAETIVGFAADDSAQVPKRKFTYRTEYAQNIIGFKKDFWGKTTVVVALATNISGYKIAKRLRDLGYKEAMCLDSGGSVQAIFNGKEIISSDRGVADVLVIRKKKK